MTPIRLGKVQLSEEIELLRGLEQTLKAARAKALLIADATGDHSTASKMEFRVVCSLDYAIDAVHLALYSAQQQQDEKADSVTVPIREDLGRS